MPYCHKCGSEVKEENAFCSQCGASLKAGEARQSEIVMHEKEEKHEKHEKEEKMEKNEQQEKYEKQEFGVLGPLVGGFILILVGLMFYFTVSGVIAFHSVFPFVLIIIGAIIIIGVVIGSVKAKERNPKT
ncbi:MAG: zinc ribbon domain-containing protein [Candidatus Bathyarchaeota archaeon]|nr:zinc ribbon domain-containing protein [Candidatus Bathyarchaeum sp.]